MAQLSLIVTSYNVDQYVEASLQSVLDQSLTDTEVIVVDDGSTDSSADIIERVAKSDPRVIPLLLKENSPGGVATAANAGLDLATAPYVGFVDADDLCDPVMFERLLGAAVATDSDLAMCNYRLLDDDSGELAVPADEHRWRELEADYFQLDPWTRKRFLRFVAGPWRKLYRREFLESNAIRFPEGDFFFEDNPFHWFSVLCAGSLALVPESLYYHRVTRAGQTMATPDERLFRIFAHHQTILDWLLERGLDASYRSSLLEWVISQFEWIVRRTPSDLRRELYQSVRPIIEEYSFATIDEALRDGRKGDLTRQLVRSLRNDSFADFNRVLDYDGASSSLVEKARYHLRYGGVREAARVATRFAASRTVPRRSSSGGAEGIEAAEARLRNKDIMFALLVMERRLGAIDDRLRCLESRLEQLGDRADE